MQLMTALAISIVVGALAALIVWLVWSFVENVQAMKQAAPPEREEEAAAESAPKTGATEKRGAKSERE
ncbi:MAG: hypothetical protein AMXMBFR4_26700 [Candidatus Hydrogenedentota bacterium]